MRVVILGGYGVFGGRLALLLADEPRLTLVLAGRSTAKADAFAATLPPGARIETARVDRDGDVEAQLAALKPDVVIDATGPFQTYGERPYRVIEAALAVGAHYLDLADGAEFVDGVFAYDAAARQAGRVVLSGVSSFPVLTAAVVDALSHDMVDVRRVTGGIAPSPYAGVGLNVIRAVAGYAGKPVKLVRDGRRTAGRGLVEIVRRTVSPPGRLPLRNIRFSLVDVPDLRVLPRRRPELRDVWMGAGPVPEILHRMLNGLARGVAAGVLPSLEPFAPVFHRAINLLRWGEHRGGMFVDVHGVDGDGLPIHRSWHLLAEGDDGPLIPSMAAEAIVRKMLDGQTPAPGARSAAGDLDLADYDALFARRTIHTGVREPVPAAAPLYRRVLTGAWERLPAPIRDLHDLDGDLRVEGTADVERGTGLASRIVGAVFGFPRAGRQVPVAVDFKLTPQGEVWRRTFDGRSFHSVQSEGTGRFEGLVVERFGPFAFGLALVLEDDRLNLAVRRWTAFGVPMPAAWAPGGPAHEAAEDGRFRFHVEIGLPLVGLVVRYRGWLARADREPEAPAAEAA
ncbi:DUF4166 domain-containing protein [Caulobacter sp. 17J65-9]|uniref:DUF4166 domain-containing protein n=1 Tax=Caulobacter sp. 17J65-9 TaxID=2709382 RepID=UPI0013CBC546|nr:DUF4166 domain-containing protein [Caulobacter sp. 17J65-9]NEX93294.1 DUF4166 domain-containing protein [Caulobacter sp. 17J65-9]